jgi:DNA modification methylase
MIRLLAGDCRDVLATLPEASVQCVVTSPPYYGLRDYGTAQWDGGDVACDHVKGMARNDVTANRLAERAAMYGTGTGAGSAVPAIQFRDTCGKCGARRIDSQIGLEATPCDYLTAMVAVFRDVRRVLRDDGTCFVNIGDSYASGGKCPTQSPLPVRVLACDSGDTAPRGSLAPDYACRDLCDGCRDALLIHTGSISLLPSQSLPHAWTTGRDSARLDDGPSTQGVAPLVAQASTSPVSSWPPSASCSHCANCGACLSVLRSSSRDARECVRSSWLNIPKFSHEPKPKDLLMMPARLALALQADGWWLRSDIIWHKPNPMPESVTDRPTSAHEHVFLLTKAAKYFYDADAVREPSADPVGSASRYGYAFSGTSGGDAVNDRRTVPVGMRDFGGNRNMRNVWTIATAPFSEAHFATFPPALAERCIKAGTRLGDTVLDPFAGAGTTLLVADRLQRDAIGIELNPGYTEMAMQRCQADAPLFTAFPPADDPEDARMADLFADLAAD